MRVETTKTGERIIVDPSAALTRIFTYFYLFINIGSLIGQVGMSYTVRYVGFHLSFLIPTVLFLVTFPALYFCCNMYAKRKPKGSVLAPAIKLFLLALKGRLHLNLFATWRHWNDGTFWQSVKVIWIHACQ